MKQSKKNIYILDHKLKWSVFKKLQEKLVKDSGSIAKNLDKNLWAMMRKKIILCYFVSDMPNDMGICVSLPKQYKDYKKYVIKNP